MHEDEHLEAAYEDRFEVEDDHEDLYGEDEVEEEVMVTWMASYEVAFEVEVPEGATEDEVRDAYLETFEDYINQGGAPDKASVKVTQFESDPDPFEKPEGWDGSQPLS